MSDDLLPCPFCGGAARVSTYETESLWSHDQVTYTKVECGECDIAFHSEPGYEVESPAAWNRRSSPISGEVKGLRWVKSGKVLWTAKTFYGTYGIERQSDSIGHTFWCWFKQGLSTETVSGYNSNLAAAKSSAQSEHDRNINSALAVPETEAGSEPVATMHLREDGRETIFSKGWVTNLTGFASTPLYTSPQPAASLADGWAQKYATALMRLTARGDGLVGWIAVPTEAQGDIAVWQAEKDAARDLAVSMLAAAPQPAVEVPDIKFAIADYLELRDEAHGFKSSDEERTKSAIELHDSIQVIHAKIRQPVKVDEAMVDRLLREIKNLPRSVMETHDNNGDVFVSLRRVLALSAALLGGGE